MALKPLRVLNDLFISFQPRPWKLRKPVVIQFPVNDICNAGCQMCNIWKQKLNDQISPEELERIVGNALYTDVRTVGMNGGEPTLRKDLADLAEVLFQNLPKLEIISIITNGVSDKKIIQRIKEVGQVARKYGAQLDVMVSLDGVGEVHDRVRGRKNNFDSALRVLDYIQSSDLVTSVRLGCTVVRDNVYGLHDLHDFATNRNVYIKYRLAIPHQRLYSDDVVAPFALTAEEKSHFCIFLENVILHYEKSERQKYFYRSLIGQLMMGSPRAAGCEWQHRGVTITSKGDLLYCAVKSKTLGSAIKEDGEQLYFENAGHLATIVSRECDSCTHDYTGLPPGPIFLQHLLREMVTIARIPESIVNGTALPLPLIRLAQRWRFSARLRAYGLDNAEITPVMRVNVEDQPGSMQRILICGWYGTETLGDKAILAGIVSALRNVLGDIALYIVSLEPCITEITVRQMPELSNVHVVTVSEGLSLTDSMDFVVFGGGPVMAIKNLADVLAIFDRAARESVPAILAGCGVGPLGGKYQNRMIARLLKLSSLRIYRDKVSLDHATKLGIDTSRDMVVEDPAFTWIIDKQKEEAFVPRENDGVLRLVLGLRDWPHNQYAPHYSYRRARNIKHKFERIIAESIIVLSERYTNLSVIPYPMCTNHLGGDDRWFYRRLVNEYPELREIMDYSTLSKEYDPDSAYETFRHADAVLAMRFHALVFAVGMNIPAVACDYTLGYGKVFALANHHDIPCRSVDVIDESFVTGALSSILKQEKTSIIGGANVIRPDFTHALGKGLNDLRGIR